MQKQPPQEAALATEKSSLSITAASFDDLLRQLSGIDATVPPRKCGRTKEHTERAAICSFLSTFAGTNMFGYPLTIVKGEKPDFFLRTSLETIGIEITEAVRRSDAHVDSLEGPDTLRPINKELGLDDTVTRKEAREIKEGKQDASLYVGNESEDRWTEDIFSRIVEKKGKFRNYERCGKNWLYIYDNLPHPAPNRRLASENLSLKVQSSKDAPFDRIFIEFAPNDEIAQLDVAGGEVTFHAVRNGLRNISLAWPAPDPLDSQHF